MLFHVCQDVKCKNILVYIVLFSICFLLIFVTNREDRSVKGHILGHAQAQPQAVVSERNLTPLACGVLRCLTHIAMLLGTAENIQVCQVSPYYQGRKLGFSIGEV